jgi:hypothetical protein
VDKITVVCHKDHDRGYEDYVGKCLLCVVERLQKRAWVGLTDEERDECINGTAWVGEEKEVRVKIVEAIEAKLKEKNTCQSK